MSRFKPANIGILGDVMQDRWVQTEVNRVSPEAPVLIAKVRSDLRQPGGAANVDYNIASLGGHPYLWGVVGSDGAGADLLEYHAGRGKLVVMDQYDHRPTTVKIRILSGTNHIVRIDREATEPIPDEVFYILYESIKKELNSLEGFILADYGKGVLSHPDQVADLIELLQSKKIPILVDPKTKDVSKFQGATIITPNAKELALISGMPVDSYEEVAKAVREAQLDVDFRYVLVKRGSAGMSLYYLCKGKNDWLDTERFLFPSLARRVGDVTGAGDTVSAAFMLAYLTGIPVEECVRTASVAAALVVESEGTSCTTAEAVDEFFKNELIPEGASYQTYVQGKSSSKTSNVEKCCSPESRKSPSNSE